MQTCTNSQPVPRDLRLAIAGDAVADLLEAAELLDVDMDEPAGLVILVTLDRGGRFEITHPGQPGPPQHPADGGRRHPQLQARYACR